tara:strand:- start:36 stop:518 length:483 start_codon:yes stop_codon:yes gene_type:complete
MSADVEENGAVVKRLRLFKRIGFQVLDIDYIQPSLGEGKMGASNLLLLVWLPAIASEVLSESSEDNSALSSSSSGFLTACSTSSSQPTPVVVCSRLLKKFLREYELSCEVEAQDERFTNMVKKVKESVAKKESVRLFDAVSKEALEKYVCDEEEEENEAA